MQSNIDTTTTVDCPSSKSIDHRRKRINRMKTAIVIIVILFLMLPTILCIILGIQVNHLQKQMKQLVDLHSQYGLTYEDPNSINYAYAAEKSFNTVNGNGDSLNEINTELFLKPEISTKSYNALLESTKIKDKDLITKASNPVIEDQDKDLDPLQINTKEEIAAPESSSDLTSGNTQNNESENINTKGIYAGKQVFLTFDDGPSIYTDDILDILADYKVKATFFVIGKTDKESKKLYQRIVNEGHTLGMHSYSHKYEKVYNSIEDFDRDFTKLRKLLYDTTGYKPSIFRFPGGSDNLVNKNGMDEFIQYLNKASIVYFDWNVVSGDATGITYTKDQLINNVISGVAMKKRSIVLMHDSQTKETTVESLPGLLDALISGGAQILPLDKEVPPIQMIKADSIK